MASAGQQTHMARQERDHRRAIETSLHTRCVQCFFDQQAPEAGAVDKQITLNDRAILQDDRLDESGAGLQAYVADLFPLRIPTSFNDLLIVTCSG